MKRNDILRDYKIDKKRLMEYGFEYHQGKYSYKKAIQDQLQVIVIISQDIDVYVEDIETKERYLPFEIIHNNGDYVTKIKMKVEEILDDIMKQCFIKINTLELIHTYIQQKYNIQYDCPFKKDNVSCTYRTPKGKWFALFMNIPFEKLDINQTGNVDIILVKGQPQDNEKRIDHHHFYKAYHMNKTKWMTILIDKDLDLKETYQLIDTSYQLVSSHS